MNIRGPLIALLITLFATLSAERSAAPTLQVALEPGTPSWVRISLMGGMTLMLEVEGRADARILLVILDPSSQVIVNSTFVGTKRLLVPIGSSGVYLFGLFPISVDTQLQVRINYEYLQTSLRERIPPNVLVTLIAIVMLSMGMFVYILVKSPPAKTQGSGPFSSSE